MTESLIEMLTEQLGEEFSSADKRAWKKVFDAIVIDMEKGQRLLDKGLAGTNKSAVVKSWRLLAVLPNYHEKAGVVMFGQ